MTQKQKWNLARFLWIFFLVAFIVTVNFILFFQFLDIGQEKIMESALLTFGNVIFISLIFTGIDTIQRYFSVQRPAKKIHEVTEAITGGDFAARVPKSYLSRGEFTEIAADINHMAEELASVETLRVDFISNVSHELKTPLAVMRNYATMLESDGLTEAERLEYAKGIKDATGRLSELITNILKLNKLENQQIYPEKTRYNLGEQISECLLAFESQWEERDIDMDIDLAEEVYIEADPELLTLVWNNLLSNAFKFTEDGGKISIHLTADTSRVTLAVSDNGCGMDPETGAHIFDKFYQGDTSHKMAGNGLGLALVKRVVDIMDGEISVESKLGEGSTFIVSFSR